VAVIDDLKRLAAEDMVYATRVVGALPSPGAGATEVFRGRLRQAANGDWVLTTFLGQNGVVGLVLGQPGDGWTSSESPAGGLSIRIETKIFVVKPDFLSEIVVLTTVVPAGFVE
jgi:hypothetical protein